MIQKGTFYDNIYQITGVRYYGAMGRLMVNCNKNSGHLKNIAQRQRSYLTP